MVIFTPHHISLFIKVEFRFISKYVTKRVWTSYSTCHGQFLMSFGPLGVLQMLCYDTFMLTYSNNCHSSLNSIVACHLGKIILHVQGSIYKDQSFSKAYQFSVDEKLFNLALMLCKSFKIKIIYCII